MIFEILVLDSTKYSSKNKTEKFNKIVIIVYLKLKKSLSFLCNNHKAE